MMNHFDPRKNYHLTRCRFFRAAAGLTGGVIGSKLVFPTWARASGHADPKPIPGGTTLVFEQYFRRDRSRT